MKLIQNFRYRPEIDGLRAVAVIVVVLFHGGFGLSGGFVGVDVFFVVSGFLITSIIWKDLESGTFTFAQFWERRARRIVPALVVMTIGVLLAGCLFMLPIDLVSLGKSAISQSLFSGNIYFWLDSGYFADDSSVKPLLHTWSLAVEEQFYFVTPFLMWAIFRVTGLRRRKMMLWMIASLCLASLSLSVYGVAYHREATFYLLPTRAWELLMGAFVAFLPARKLTFPHKFIEFCGYLSLALILAPAALYTEKMPFPGLAALPPCLGSALFVWANSRAEGSPPTVVGRVLSIRPIVLVGLISYSLYLWHWPVFAFDNYLALKQHNVSWHIALLLICFVLAFLSWKYVETPFRRRLLGQSRRSMLAYAGVGIISVFCLGVLMMAARGIPQRLTAEQQKSADAKSDSSFITETDIGAVKEGRVTHLGVAKDSDASILVWGDSHAMATLPAIDEYLTEIGVFGEAATHSNTAPILDWYKSADFGLGKGSLDYNTAVFLRLERGKIQNVLLVARWKGYVDGLGKVETDVFKSAMVGTVAKLSSMGIQVWIMREVPDYNYNVPKALSLPLYSPSFVEELRKSNIDQVNIFDEDLVQALSRAGGKVLDPKPAFIDNEGYYRTKLEGVVLYRDDHHLTATGARSVLLPFFRRNLILARQSNTTLTQ